MNSMYCTGTGLSRPRKWRARATVSGVARCPTASRAGSAGMMKKMTYVIDRDRDEQDHLPRANGG